MKAIVCSAYGPLDSLQLAEVAKPAPKADQVLVKVYASSVNFNAPASVTGKPLIVRLMSGAPFTPKHQTPGNDIAGRVEAVGSSVKRFKPGDEVYGDLAECGYGAYAEYVAVPEAALALKPDNITYEQAAAVPEAGLVALQALRDFGGLKAGHKVLISGASGGIGSFAVQIAKALGAEVTAVCSTRNLDMVRSLGADHAIDYTQEDFVQTGQTYDLIVATAGYRSLADYKRALKPNGVHVATGGDMKQIFEPMLFGWWRPGGKKLGSLVLKVNKDLDFLSELLASGQVVPVIDRCYPLAEAGEALKYYAQGRTRGKIIISVAQDGD
ncbi:MAG: NAD(P)-dependent alcohol dehydrogenase [Anaerolineae bacterium]|nr:NAD(P)-dependent alcohol dehydrogenase [Anaerolineae bacterium]